MVYSFSLLEVDRGNSIEKHVWWVNENTGKSCKILLYKSPRLGLKVFLSGGESCEVKIPTLLNK